MFYRPEDGHGLPHNPFNAIVTPRPIGWISTRGPLGRQPCPLFVLQRGGLLPAAGDVRLDRGQGQPVQRARDRGLRGEHRGRAMLEAMSETSAALPPGTDEFTHAGVAQGRMQHHRLPRAWPVRPPRWNAG